MSGCKHEFGSTRYPCGFTIGDPLGVCEHVFMPGAMVRCTICGTYKITEDAKRRLDELERELPRSLKPKRKKSWWQRLIGS